jgi:predicted acetyltransferase
MRILEYDEVDEQQVLELNLTCFGWFLTPKQVKTIRKVDKHVPDYFSLYAVEKEEILSQVGVVTVDTQTKHGVEEVGHIWGVCTKPSAARKGSAKKLMEETHARLLTDDIKYSFLGTGKSLVAYNLYRQLGYVDFVDLNWGMKRCKPIKQSDIDVTFASDTKDESFADLFTKYSNGLLGFVHRPKNFLQVRKAWSWMPISMSGIFRKGKKHIGYVLGSREGKVVRIRELCCPRIEDTKRCIEALEIKFKPKYMTVSWMSRSCITKEFIKSGFKRIDESWGAFMIKDLEGKHKIDQIQSAYGIEEDKFQMTTIDEY